jgi:uncharacterized protein YjiK
MKITSPKKLFFISIALSSSLFIVGCGGGSSSPISAPAPAGTPPETPPPVSLPTVPQQPTANQLYHLDFIESFNLDVAEPSGLSWALNGKDLLVVDDRNNKAYKIDKQGHTLSEFLYAGNDLEGISIDSQSQTIWLAEEAKSKMVELDASGNEIQSFKLAIDRQSKKHSLEGISYDPAENTFYLLNEKDPGLLVVWQAELGITAETVLNFAGDYSGIYFDKTDSTLWIISDQSQKLFHCDTDGVVKQSFDLGFKKAEGIVIDHQNQRVYAVSDAKHKLYVYSLTTQQ